MEPALFPHQFDVIFWDFGGIDNQGSLFDLVGGKVTIVFSIIMLAL
jgi:hypothetical protein